MRFTRSLNAVLWDPPATAGVLDPSYNVTVLNKTGQVIVSDTTNNTYYLLPVALMPCQFYTAIVTAFSSEHHSESVVSEPSRVQGGESHVQVAGSARNCNKYGNAASIIYLHENALRYRLLDSALAITLICDFTYKDLSKLIALCLSNKASVIVMFDFSSALQFLKCISD